MAWDQETHEKKTECVPDTLRCEFRTLTLPCGSPLAMEAVGRSALALFTTGLLGFIFAVVAENKLEPRCGHGGIDQVLAFAVLSILFLIASTLMALFALVYPHDKKKLPASNLWSSPLFTVFFGLSIVLFFTTEGLLVWATAQQGIHKSQNGRCVTAKPGVLGGAAFLGLDTTLFWLVCLMLLCNARSDYFDAEDSSLSKEFISKPVV